MDKLTQKQRAVLDFIEKFYSKNSGKKRIFK